ncbi:putative reverse transcriptase domain-containing protein, partial [Tanacetum coccineum]
MLRATQPASIQAAILTVGILTDKAVRSGTLAKAGEKRKERDEASKSESVGKDEKKAKGGRGFVATVPPIRENGNFPKCARCKGFHAEKGPSIVCYNCQRSGHMAKDCRTPVRHAEPIRAVRPRDGQRVLGNRLDDEESNHEDASDIGAAPKQQQQVIPQITDISNIKLPILKKEEYDIWAMEMEHYL